MEYGSWMVVKRKPRKTATKQRSLVDHIPPSIKGSDNDKYGNVSKSTKQPRPIIQEESVNTSNRFGVIAVEENSSVEVPGFKELAPEISPTQKENTSDHLNMEIASSSLEETPVVANRPVNERVVSPKPHSKSGRRKDKAKKVLAWL
ncbi:hypothetical protein SLA2020_002150 [Shorea laevis]